MNLPIHDPVLIVALAMGAFWLMPLLTERLRLPDIIGILLAGVILGPHGSGLLERDETIQLLGTVGLLYLVFLAGLEVDLGDLRRNRKAAITFGVVTFLVPQVLGTIGAMVLFDFSIAPAVLLGSVFSSHSFLALLIAKRLGLTERPLVVAVIGGTVITDTLALFVLAVVAQSTMGAFGVGSFLQLLVQTIVFSGVVVFGLPILGRWFFHRVNDGRAQFTFMMTVLFTCGYVAHVAGLEPIIGAFLAGLSMNRLVPHLGVLANRAFFVGNTIFVPFFLLSVGMLIDLRMVASDLPTIGMAVFMTASVIICKGLAAWFLRPLFGASQSEVGVAWGLSLPQAATTLAVVLVGHDLELFNDAILNATVVMVLVTCVLGPILVQMAGRRLADAAPHHQPSEREQHLQRILIPLSNPASSHDLLDLAVTLRRPLNDAPILPLAVADREQSVAEKEALLSDSVVHLAAAEAPVTPVIRVDPNVVNGIVRAMGELRASTVIVGWSGPESNWQRHFHLSRGLIDELVEDTTAQLFVVRLRSSLALVDKITLVVPQFAGAEWGFAELVSDCRLISKRIGASFDVTGPGLKDAVLVEDIRQAAGKGELDINVQESENSTLAHLLENKDKRSLIIIVGCRPGTASWSGPWSRIHHRLAHSKADTSVIVAYPRLSYGSSTRTDAVAVVPDTNLLHQANFLLHQPCAELPLVIKRALDSSGMATSSDKDARTLSNSLGILSPEIGLVHMHHDQTARSRLLVVVTDAAMDEIHEGLHILLILINATRNGPEQHLHNLSHIARAFGDETRVQALRAAQTEDEARSIWQDIDEG